MSIKETENDSTVAEQTVERLKLDKAKKRLTAVKILSGTGLAGLGLVGVGAWILTGHDIGTLLTDEIKTFAVSLVGFGIVFAPATIWGVKKLWNPDLVFVVRVNGTLTDVVDIYVASPERWQDVDIVSGEPYSFTVGGAVVYLVTDFTHVSKVAEDDELADHIPDDTSGYVAAGSWLGEASDADIVSARHEIEGNRRRNNAWARIGEKLYSKFETVAQSVESRHHKMMTDKSMDMSLYDSETVKQEAAAAVPELEEYDESKSMPEIIEDEVEQQLREINTSDNGGERR
ncbi:hypothetical protein [Halorussus sp. MSC15.2]|uniref:hypothetical protein n=1 Tax=Halorussus sp. MSC15.2 TaxID=2283638 RepID=UPI0013CFF23E|nr:hypothetical protein [Halorussus sp. MSC15.2]NEU56266.1 hypothetical protein [Halorussus sp. MSC15.2]